MRIDWYKAAPEGYRAMKELDRYGEQSKLEPLLKELLRIRISQINGCAYCLDMHTKDARALGESEQRIDLLPAWKETEGVYSPREIFSTPQLLHSHIPIFPTLTPTLTPKSPWFLPV